MLRHLPGGSGQAVWGLNAEGSAPSSEPGAALNEAQVIDQGAIERIRAMEQRGATGLLARLIETYLQTSEHLCAELQQALQRGEAGVARQAAHTLKSASANVGASALAALCTDMEHLARGNQIQKARDVWPELLQAHERSCAQLRQISGLPREPDPASAQSTPTYS